MIDPLTDKAEDIFYSALELRSSDQRQAYLASACRGDAELRSLVDKLLAAQPAAEDFFQEGGVVRLPMQQLSQSLAETPGLADKTDSAPLKDESIGKYVGPYKLLQRIGEGGCGVV